MRHPPPPGSGAWDLNSVPAMGDEVVRSSAEESVFALRLAGEEGGTLQAAFVALPDVREAAIPRDSH